MYSQSEENRYLAVLDEQLVESNPPEVRRTYEQLIAQGYTSQYARLLLGNLLAREIQTSLKTKQSWDIGTYVAAVQQLAEEEAKLGSSGTEQKQTRQQQIYSAINRLRQRRGRAKN